MPYARYDYPQLCANGRYGDAEGLSSEMCSGPCEAG